MGWELPGRKCIAVLQEPENNSGIFSFQRLYLNPGAESSLPSGELWSNIQCSFPALTYQMTYLKVMVQRENVGLFLSSLLPMGPEQRQNLLILQQVLTWKPARKCILYAAGITKDHLQALEGKGGGGSEWLMSLSEPLPFANSYLHIDRGGNESSSSAVSQAASSLGQHAPNF